MKTWYELNFDDVKDIQDGSVRKRIDKAISFGVRDGLQQIERQHKLKYFIRGKAASMKTHPTKITWRTGTLAQSYERYWKEGQSFGYYGSTLKRAALLEYGGTVSAKPGKALAIPTAAAKVGVGGTVSPRDYPPGELFIPNWPKGSGVLARIGSGGALEVMFTLVKSVRIPPRPTVKKAAKDMGKPFEMMMAKRIAKAMEKQ
jgi:hypothetical protein